MRYVILVRHGETEWNVQGRYQGRSETDLSARGRDQADRLAGRLAEVRIDSIFSSPLRRTMATAEAVARGRALRVVPVPELIEIGHGEWEGLTVEEVKQKFSGFWDAWQREPHLVQFPGGESLSEVRSRVVSALRRILRTDSAEIVLVCGHDAVNKVILIESLHLPLSEFWRIRQDSTCINLLEVSENDLRPVVINDSSHLGPLIRAAEHKAL